MNQRGFTLLELLTAMAVTTVVSAAGYTFFNNSYNFTLVHSRNNEMQRESRVAIDLMVRDIRNAGFGVLDPLTGAVHPAAAAFPVITSGNNVDNDPSGVANMLDTISISGGYRLVGTLNVAAAGSATTVVLVPLAGTNPTNPSIVGNTVTIDGFYTSTVTAVTGPIAGAYTLTLGAPLNRAYRTGNTVSILQQINYRVALNGAEPALWRNDGVSSQVIASGIEDLQLAYFLDDGSIVNNPVGALSPIRGVRVSLAARGQNPNGDALISTRPALEDHAVGATADAYHRRLITRVVEIRNLGL